MSQPSLEVETGPLDAHPTPESTRQNQPVIAPVCLVLGSLGAIVATLAEMVAKQEVSVTVRLKEVLVEHAGLAIEAYYVIVFFVFLGAVMTFVSQTRNYYKAFYAGASILTIFMTVIPTGLPPSLNASVAATPPVRSASFEAAGPVWGFQLAAFESLPSPNPEVHVTIATQNRRRVSDVVITLRNQRGRLTAKGRYRSGRFAFRQPPGTYRVVIDVPGYQSQTKMVRLVSGRRESLHFELRPTWRPVILQRLLRTY